MRFENYLKESDITYEQYVMGVESYFATDEGVKEVKDKAVAFVKSKLKEASDDIDRIIFDTGLSMVHIIHALVEKDVYKLLKAFGFSIKIIVKVLNDLTNIIRKGLFDTFNELHKSKVFQLFRREMATWDEVVKEHPILKKVTGPMVAGLMFFMWTQMTFIGNVDFDLDFTDISDALKGNYSLEQIFGSPQGLMLLSLFATGSLISVPWLGKTTYNVVLALTYTGLKRLSSIDHKIVNKIKAKMEFV